MCHSVCRASVYVCTHTEAQMGAGNQAGSGLAKERIVRGK